MAGAIRNEDFHGAWTLVRWRRIGPDGAESFPFGEKALGRILYEPGGRMACYLMNPAWVAGAAAEGMTGYSGAFQVDGGSIRHQVDFATIPRLVGTEQVRKATFTAAGLQLEAPVSDSADARHVLEWRRES